MLIGNCHQFLSSTSSWGERSATSTNSWGERSATSTNSQAERSATSTRSWGERSATSTNSRGERSATSTNSRGERSATRDCSLIYQLQSHLCRPATWNVCSTSHLIWLPRVQDQRHISHYIAAPMHKNYPQKKRTVHHQWYEPGTNWLWLLFYECIVCHLSFLREEGCGILVSRLFIGWSLISYDIIAGVFCCCCCCF